jgi:glycogen debranching enzyme
MNLCKAPGQLRHFISSFPNRGKYPTHFLWDSCFQNLAYELLNPRLARDSLLQLTSCIRSDGKIPQFLCSTWSRPGEAQPALIGWAAQRLEKIPGQEDIGLILLPALEHNCHWWLTNRMTKYGLIETGDGLETGWDNSPRFDYGSILALDMNSYLINQLRYVSDLCCRLGREEDAGAWKQEADSLAAQLVELCYDPEKNLFFDVLVGTGKRLSTLTPAAFLPLWVGVPLKEDCVHAMIENTLLSPLHFFGQIPFPSVAYDDPAYACDDWWRGPTWMSAAYLMLETLSQYGYAEQALAAGERLYQIILQDGKTHELFNSKTGEGLGGEEQGWTAAVFLRLKHDLSH